MTQISISTIKQNLFSALPSPPAWLRVSLCEPRLHLLQRNLSRLPYAPAPKPQRLRAPWPMLPSIPHLSPSREPAAQPPRRRTHRPVGQRQAWEPRAGSWPAGHTRADPVLLSAGPWRKGHIRVALPETFPRVPLIISRSLPRATPAHWKPPPPSLNPA